IALVTFLIAASFFLLKVFIAVTIVTIIVKTVMKLTGNKNKERDGAAAEGITVDKVISSLTDSAKEYVELCKTGYAKSVEYSKTGYTKSVTTVKDLIEKRKGTAAAVESKPEETEPLIDNKAEAEVKPEEEKKNE
ncbi:hypothetical protein PIROE2DRAFT_15043, partial [Piromyces sp. E2]